jgi:hypothetical protein
MRYELSSPKIVIVLSAKSVDPLKAFWSPDTPKLKMSILVRWIKLYRYRNHSPLLNAK